MGDDGAGDPFWVDSEFRERVRKEGQEAECVSELQETFEGWGFSPTVDKYVEDLIHESGYRVTPRQDKGGAWTVEIKPKNDGKFDPARAQTALHDLDYALKYGLWQMGENDENKDVLPLATQLCLAAKTSLEKHGDLRDAVKEMADYRLRNQSHPNASKRHDLRRMVCTYLRARVACKHHLNLFEDEAASFSSEWADEAIKRCLDVAAEYVSTPNAHTPWLTRQISAWLLQPYITVLGYRATQLFPPSRIGARWKRPWCNIVPWCISILLFLLSVVLVGFCYADMGPTGAYLAAGLCGLLYARRYVQTREFRKDQARITRLLHKVSDLHNEVKNGKYNAGEVIRRFREIEADDLRLPSIFVSVIALPKLKPAKQPAAQALELNL